MDDEELEAMVTQEEQQDRKRNRRILMMWLSGFVLLLLGGWIWLKIPLGSTPSFQSPADAPSAQEEPVPASGETPPVTPAATPPETGQKPAATQETEPTRPALPSGDPHKLMHGGHYLEAAQVWQKQLVADPVPYSILLELACREESIQAALSRTPADADVFILPRKRGEQTCFLLFWGRFPTREDAQIALRTIPPYFWKQDPPEVTPLEAYL